MSDPTLEEESLISQDDIDMLLDASSLEEAEEALDAPAEELDLDLDDMGELSQDDIDSLLSGPEETLDADEDEGGELSQDDIDSLMGGGDDGGELSQDDIDSLMGGGDDDDGELSQDDIDSMLGGGDDEDDEELELISQDDIDSLVNGSDESDDDDDDELISMDDIQDLIGDIPEKETAETEVQEAAPEDAVGNLAETAPDSEDISEIAGEEEVPAADAGGADPYDEVISDGDAVAVADCLITQETMDELIRNAPAPQPEPEPAAAGPDAEPELEADLDSPVDLDLGDGPVDLDVSEDDLDSFLDDADDDINLGLGADAEGDVTQEDIDALLQESDDGDDFLDEDDDILISQDDIDTLLMAADQEDEDVLGDLLGDALDDGVDEFEDHEVVSSSFEEEEADTDQVVLEGEEEDEAEVEWETSERIEKIKGLLKSKLVLAAASIFLVLGISVPTVYFLFFSEKPMALPDREAVPVAAQEDTRDISVASVSIEQEPEPVLRQSGTIVLTDFVILSSDLEKEMTYVYADISIDYSDQRAYHEISNNISFYRDLIYEAIHTSLVSEKRNEVTESDLLWGVETSLKRVLPPNFIEKISFKTFRTS